MLKALSQEKRTVKFKNSTIEYTFFRKNVKNLNLQIKSDGRISVSANSRVSKDYIDSFVISKGDFILSAIAGYAKTQKNTVVQIEHTQQECRPLFEQIACETHKRFVQYGVLMPQIKIRTMKSRWGSCIPTKGIITLNTNLLDKPLACIEYVVLHEFCHFIHQNHSKDFYTFVEMLMPDWKERKKLLDYQPHEN